MPPTTAPVELTEEIRGAEGTSPEKKERPGTGPGERKFVIKILTPVPA